MSQQVTVLGTASNTCHLNAEVNLERKVLVGLETSWSHISSAQRK